MSVSSRSNRHSIGTATADVKAGSISVLCGPMFSGKSTELLRRVRRHLAAAEKCLLIKYKGDTRYGQEPVLTTHDMVHMVAKSVTTLSEADNAAWHYDVIAVDEGQFFPDLVECVNKWADDGKTVLVSALDATFQAKPFMNVLQLIPLAEHVSKLTAICTGCRKEASFTKRLSSETDVEVVGGADKYTALCRSCFNKSMKEPSHHSHGSTSDSTAASNPKRQSQRKSSRLQQENSQPNRRESLEALSQPSASMDRHVEQRRRSLQAVTLR